MAEKTGKELVILQGRTEAKKSGDTMPRRAALIAPSISSEYSTRSGTLVPNQTMLDHSKTCFACGQSISQTVHSNYFFILAQLFKSVSSSTASPVTGFSSEGSSAATPLVSTGTSSVNNILPNGAKRYTYSSSTAQRDENSSSLGNVTTNTGYYSRFFRQIRQLGRGYRGAVFYCQHILSHEIVLGFYAVKKIPVGENKEWLIRMLNEVYLLEEMRHPNIIEYRHCWLEEAQLTNFGPSVPCLFVLMEYANGGNLEDFVLSRFSEQLSRSRSASPTRYRKLSWKGEVAQSEEESSNSFGNILEDNGLTAIEIWSFLIDICAGMKHLHQHGILHRDLKPSNLLLRFQNPNSIDEIPSVLISDFGESESLNWGAATVGSRTGATGTIEYTAPELLKADKNGVFFVQYSPSADMWSLGMNVYFMFKGNLPYINLEDITSLRQEILDYTFESERSENLSTESEEILVVLGMLLKLNPRERPTASELLLFMESQGIKRAKERHRRRRHRRAIEGMSFSDEMLTTDHDDFKSSIEEVTDVNNEDSDSVKKDENVVSTTHHNVSTTIITSSQKPLVKFISILVQLLVLQIFNGNTSILLTVLALASIFIDNIVLLFAWTVSYSLIVLITSK